MQIFWDFKNTHASWIFITYISADVAQANSVLMKMLLPDASNTSVNVAKANII